ncbi:hypothetical protein DUNSADRAFT_2440 [Dunaliella salina]|uniref:Uncharacterized protein n=1 Tax=Dunaliella salina TaxID=3046 RepID=A0ABQ7GVP2_DUNSA|nr:hypothetical protein DUNSADRAFT_2440 [Dunaliella salina]|eukprot:KAF5838676.1 hypothetical protein DUNSADRAFT_2440 [Dunaliella salina]
MMNHVPSARKITQMERHMNVLVGYMLIWVLFESIMLGAGDQIFNGLNHGLWYLRINGEWPELGQGFAGWIVQTIRFIILTNGFIPISLYITLEMIKVLQCTLMLNQDRKMYHKPSDTPFACRTTSLNEDLGQVRKSLLALWF